MASKKKSKGVFSQFSIFSFVLVILFLGFDVWLTAVSTTQSSWSKWSGTTSRGYPMSFYVSSAGTQWKDFKLKTNWNAGWASGTVEITISSTGNISSGQFNYNGGSLSFTGQFDSTTTASGTYAFSSYQITIGLPYPPYITYYYLSQTGTWTASGPPLPSSKPIVTTGSATSISSNSATLNGTVNPNDKSTTYYFQYGTTASYGSSTSTENAGAGSADVSVRASITGLNPDTTYHYRLVATNSEGTSYGEDMTFTTTSTPTEPKIALSRTQLYFGATTNGAVTDVQQFLVSNIGEGTLNWSVSDNQNWLSCIPASGTNSGVVTAIVDPSGLSAGTYIGTITVSDANAINSPQTLTINLNVYRAGNSETPFGDFATPGNNSTVRSSVPVTGWVLDDVGVVDVKIYNGNDYIGNAVLVEGARPDVENAYPGYPMNYKAGWGYMMLTNFLPNEGNGIYTIYAKATDKERNQVILGSKTITCDNANAVKPFGAIDTPDQGGTASRDNFINWGWTLTPQPNGIPTDGSTINVFVDGVNLGHPTYNNYRSDIAALFPGYVNSNGAAGYFYLDTTAHENGVHTIQWTVTDDAGNTDGIGSRYFTIMNTDNANESTIAVSNHFHKCSKLGNNSQRKTYFWKSQISEIPMDSSLSIRFGKGFNHYADMNSGKHYEKNFYPLTIKEDEPVKIYLGNTFIDFDEKIKTRIESVSERLDTSGVNSSIHIRHYSGYQVIGEQLKHLPIGSILDSDNGIFYWQPGPGFLGDYDLVFIIEDVDGKLTKKEIRLTIVSKY